MGIRELAISVVESYGLKVTDAQLWNAIRGTQ